MLWKEQIIFIHVEENVLYCVRLVAFLCQTNDCTLISCEQKPLASRAHAGVAAPYSTWELERYNLRGFSSFVITVAACVTMMCDLFYPGKPRIQFALCFVKRVLSHSAI